MPNTLTLSPLSVASRDLINTQFLDDAAANLAAMREVDDTLAALFSDLYALRHAMSPAFWNSFVSTVCREHPVMALLHQDPLTHRAYTKPRGYAGDAVMLDFMYAVEDGQIPSEVEASTELGQAIYAFTSRFDSAEAVRARRRLLVERIDTLAERNTQPRILSVACGHLREAARSQAVRDGRVGRYVALDQDAESLEVVKRELGCLGVEPLHASVRDILSGRACLADFDLVYAAGLYDYLPTPIAQSLTAALFRALQSGGTLLVGNFLPDTVDTAYMEAIADWRLIQRSRTELLQLTETLPEREIKHIRLFTDQVATVGYIEIERK